MNEGDYCSQVAAAEARPPHGTALEAELWLLIEYERPWKAKALEDNEFSAPVRAHLAELPAACAQQGVSLRVQFIRRDSGSAEARLLFADTRLASCGLLEGRFESEEELLAINASELTHGRLPAGLGARSTDEEHFLVCTNGQRDVCCARFGLPLYRALRDQTDVPVWKTTHVGGHRYAPNLLCLPSGLMYGFVDADRAPELVRAHAAKRVLPRMLRGRTCLSAAAQSAECFLRAHLGAEGEMAVLHDVQAGAGGTGDAHTVQLVFEHNGTRRQATVTLRHEPEAEFAAASCGAAPKAIGRYELAELVLGP